jgi:hypothetical protein
LVVAALLSTLWKFLKSVGAAGASVLTGGT